MVAGRVYFERREGTLRASSNDRREGSCGDQPERLVCMKDDVKIAADDPRCHYPTSRCRFREHCPVMEAIRARGEKPGGVGSEAVGE